MKDFKKNNRFIYLFIFDVYDRQSYRFIKNSNDQNEEMFFMLMFK